MSDTMMRLEDFELFTGWKIIALPAAIELLLSGSVSYFAVGRPAVTAAGLFAAELHHCA
jgi:hypothetical protein